MCDNQIHSEGGKFLGRVLQSNSCLLDMNIRLNRLGEKGGCYVFEGLKSNNTLEKLNISGNGLGDGSGQGEAVRVFAAMLRVNTHLNVCPPPPNSTPTLPPSSRNFVYFPFWFLMRVDPKP